ncbi:hypothetical protein [Tunturiibacter lichenicola]|uniref:hypothetical protein n=1 Tax=Tunturiibacter lichenicola TaxID=2051959 RepID=UPI003D9AC66F
MASTVEAVSCDMVRRSGSLGGVALRETADSFASLRNDNKKGDYNCKRKDGDYNCKRKDKDNSRFLRFATE